MSSASLSSERPLLAWHCRLPRRAFLPGILFLFSGVAFVFPASASAASHRQDVSRPLIAIFPLKSASSEPAKDEKNEKDEKQKKEDEAVSENLLAAAARAAKDLLTERGVADAIIYSPDSPVFARAMQESKLTVSTGASSLQTPSERIALGKAVGALYVLAVEARRGDPEKGGGVEIAMRAHETASGKEWSDRVRMSQGASVLRPGVGGPSPQNALLSAVNTLIARFLAGPMRDFSRNATPPSLIPPRPASPGSALSPGETTAGTPGEEPEAVAENARRHGEALLASGDAAGAIIVLRRAVNLSPRSLALRAALTRAYLAARQYTEASAEARRALMVAASEDRNGRIEMTRLLAQALSATGDVSAARLTYEQIIAAEPRAGWARIALGDLHLRAGRIDEAEEQYRAARQNAPNDPDAALGLARVQAARGDYPGAVKELTAQNADAATRYAVAREMFDDGAVRLAALLEQNRKAFDEKQIAREAFHKATTLQSDRAAALLTLLRSVPPPPGDAVGEKAHRQRILAASLLAQTLASVLTFIEEGDENAGVQANLLLTEFRKEIDRARAAAAAAVPETPPTDAPHPPAPM